MLIHDLSTLELRADGWGMDCFSLVKFGNTKDVICLILLSECTKEKLRNELNVFCQTVFAINEDGKF